jgi:hypothetical protein
MIKAMAARPPTTPPMIAPTGVDEGQESDDEESPEPHVRMEVWVAVVVVVITREVGVFQISFVAGVSSQPSME